MIYIGFGSTAIIDTIIAIVLSHLLFKTSPPNRQRCARVAFEKEETKINLNLLIIRFKSRGVVRFLVLFFIGTGVLTACVHKLILARMTS